MKSEELYMLKNKQVSDTLGLPMKFPEQVWLFASFLPTPEEYKDAEFKDNCRHVIADQLGIWGT